jgi:putative acetyltransferase
MLIRDEEEKDRGSVSDIVAAEFDTGAESDFVDSIRKQPPPVVSLVAEEAGEVIGHILFSPAPLEGDPQAKLMGLASLAVIPEHQGKGIGSELMRAGLERCKRLGFEGVIALGHADYYSRFGFSPASRFGLRFGHYLPEDAFLALELAPGALEGRSGKVRYLAALRTL